MFTSDVVPRAFSTQWTLRPKVLAFVDENEEAIAGKKWDQIREGCRAAVEVTYKVRGK